MQIPILHFKPSSTPTLCDLPVILLAHHHLIDNCYLPMFQQHIYIVANMITAHQHTSSNIPPFQLADPLHQ